LKKEERREIGEAMNHMMDGWGKPHVHSGIGIRRLTPTIYECHVGLHQRQPFLFLSTPPELEFFFLGDHNEIQKLIRANR
jgi:hypothetical protein